jgi:hypothetical protein
MAGRRAKWQWITTLAVALTAAAGWLWQWHTQRQDEARKLAQAEAAQPQGQPRLVAPPQRPAPPPPLPDRRGQDLPAGQPWQVADLRGQVWHPLGQATAWLVVAVDSGEDPRAVEPLLQGIWRHRDLGAVVLAAPATATDGDRALVRRRGVHRLRQAIASVTANGQMAVVLGSGVHGEAALQLAGEPQVLAVAALEPAATVAQLGEEDLRRAGRKKLAWLGGSAACANTADGLSRSLPHATVQARGRGQGVAWLQVADQRASLGGWLHTALGPAK